MISNQTNLPLDGLVSELFGRASRRRGLVVAGWVLALGSHAAAAVLFANQATRSVQEPARLAIDVEFLTPEAPSPPPPPELGPPADAAPKSASAAPAAPPAAARAGALHLARADATPAQQAEQPVDFTTDPNGTSYGGGVVAVGGTAAFGAAGARVTPVAGIAPAAAPAPRPAGDGLTPLSDLSRKPQLPGSDPCRGFFPAGARDDSGEVAVLVTIGKTGRVGTTQLLSESPRGQGFGVAARACMVSQHFAPALDRAGNLAATAVRVNLRFSR